MALHLSFVGFNFGMPSVVDVALEMTGLLLAAGILIYSGSLKRLLSPRKSNVFMLVPLLALLISWVFFISGWSSITSLISYILSDGAVMVLAVGHIILLVFLAASSLQGFRGSERQDRFNGRAWSKISLEERCLCPVGTL